MKTTLKFSVLLAFLFCATTIRAQGNCANPGGIQTGDNITWGPQMLYKASETVTYQVTCTANGSTYYTGANSVTATGTYSSRSSIACNPSFWTRIYTSTSMVNSYFENFGQDGSISNGILNDTCGSFGTIHENDTVCAPVACVSSGFCGPSGCGCFWPCTTPIILDVTGKGYSLTDVKDGVLFDFAGDGNHVKMAWTAPGADNAFLVLPGPDGLVHNGMQLFGNLTAQPASNNPNGFAALAVYDDPKNGGNGDGIIDSRDAVFASLRLWIDADHDGVSQPEELFTLPSLGVNSISLTYKLSERTDQYGNVFRYRGQVNPGDAANTGRMAYDVVFVKPNPSASKPACVVPVPTKGGLLSTSGK